MKIIKVFLKVALCTVALVLMACQNRPAYSEEEAWARISQFRTADEPDSVAEALDYYLDHFSDSKYVQQVVAMKNSFQKEKQEWQEVVAYNCTIENVDKYIYEHPDGFFRGRAVATIDSLSFLDASQKKTAEAVQAYLDQYPDGKFVEQARALLGDLQDMDMTAEERNRVTGVVERHFEDMTLNSEEIVTTVAPNLSSYIGKAHSTKEDVLEYMAHVHADGEAKLISASQFSLTKFMAAGVPVYNVRFTLTEKINPDDSLALQEYHYKGTAILNSSLQITSLVLE